MSAIHEENSIKIAAWPIFVALVSVIACFVILHVVVNVCWKTQACGPVTSLINYQGHWFDLNGEGNIPTWFAVVQLFATALALIAATAVQRMKGANARGWIGLVVIFFYISLDEATDLHGLWPTGLDGEAIPGTSEASFAWIIPAAVVVLIIGLSYLRWLLALPTRTRNLFFVAGVVFVSGGLLFEALGAFLADESYFNASYLLASTAEETLELLGISIMLFGVLDYLDDQGFRFSIAKDKPL